MCLNDAKWMCFVCIQVHCNSETFIQNLINVSRVSVVKSLKRLRLPIDRDRFGDANTNRLTRICLPVKICSQNATSWQHISCCNTPDSGRASSCSPDVRCSRQRRLWTWNCRVQKCWCFGVNGSNDLTKCQWPKMGLKWTYRRLRVTQLADFDFLGNY